MTLFGTIWTKMLAAGEAPRESIFAENHGAKWHAARQECRRRVAATSALLAPVKTSREMTGFEWHRI